MLSLIIPAYNEADSIAATIEKARRVLGEAGLEHEIIVVDDGSTDTTRQVVEGAGVRLLSHPVNVGYGAALKTGIKQARYPWILISDADGTYPLEDFPKLWQHVPEFDMVVGARTGVHYWGSIVKRIARIVFGSLCSYVTGTHIPDINSGFRVFRRNIAIRNMQQISSGFSFTTTITLATLLEGYFAKYVPIDYHPRAAGKSHVRYVRDTLRSAQIIVEAILYYNPLKLFLLVALAAVAVSAIAGTALASVGQFWWIWFTWAAAEMLLLLISVALLADVVRLVMTRRPVVEQDVSSEDAA